MSGAFERLGQERRKLLDSLARVDGKLAHRCRELVSVGSVQTPFKVLIVLREERVKAYWDLCRARKLMPGGVPLNGVIK